MPLGDWAQPDDVASMICWLAGTSNRRTTGQCVFVDGGADALIRGDDIW